MRSPEAPRKSPVANPPRLLMRAIRILNGWDQRQLARATRLKQPDISYFELGRRDPSPSQARRIARILGIGVRDLFPEVGIVDEGRAYEDRS